GVRGRPGHGRQGPGRAGGAGRPSGGAGGTAGETDPFGVLTPSYPQFVKIPLLHQESGFGRLNLVGRIVSSSYLWGWPGGFGQFRRRLGPRRASQWPVLRSIHPKSAAIP